MDEEDILWSLKIISMIKEGQKLCIRNGFIHVNNRIFEFLFRWINNDNRHSSITYISNTINNALKMQKTDHLVNTLREALKGLDALKVTYATDVCIVAKITVLEEKINKHIENGKCSKNIQQQNKC